MLNSFIQKGLPVAANWLLSKYKHPRKVEEKGRANKAAIT